MCNFKIKDSYLEVFESQKEFKENIKYTPPSLQKLIIEKICIRKSFHLMLNVSIKEWNWHVRTFYNLDMVTIFDRNLNIDNFAFNKKWKNYWYTLCKIGFPLIVDLSHLKDINMDNEIQINYIQNCMKAFRLLKRKLIRKERQLRSSVNTVKKKMHFELLCFPKDNISSKITRDGSQLYQETYNYFLQ